MLPIVPVAAGVGVLALLLLGKKKAPTTTPVVFQPPPTVVNVPHPLGGTVPTVVQPPPVVVQVPTSPGGGTLGSQGFNNDINNIIQQQLDAAGAPAGPDATPPAGDTGLAPLPPPQVVADGNGGFTTVQPPVEGDLGTAGFGNTINDIINQQLANADANATVSGNNVGKRAARLWRGRGFAKLGGLLLAFLVACIVLVCVACAQSLAKTAQAAGDVVAIEQCVVNDEAKGMAPAAIATDCGLQAAGDVVSLLALMDRRAAARFACIRASDGGP